MNLPNPLRATLDGTFFARVFEVINRADNGNLKRDQDIEVGSNRVILTAANGNRYALTVSNTGTLSTTAV